MYYLKIIHKPLKSVLVFYFVRGFRTTAAYTKNGRQKSWSIMTGHVLLFLSDLT